MKPASHTKRHRPQTFFGRVGALVRRAVHRLRRAFPDTIGADLAGGCAIASSILAAALQRLGLRAKLVVGVYDDRRAAGFCATWFRFVGCLSSHAWVELDGLILDVTATQFRGHPAVYVTDVRDHRYYARHVGQHAKRALLRWTMAKGAARYQAPVLHARFVRLAAEEIALTAQPSCAA